MHPYKLKDDNITLFVNSCFLDEDDFEYANKHRFNVEFTETNCGSFAEYILKFQNMGYMFELRTKPDIAPGGIKLDDKIYAYFTHPGNINREGIIYNKNEITIIVEVLNYLICLSRLVSSNDASRYFGFNFDGAYIDLFREIKNKFYYGNLHSPTILNNEIYKHMIEELNNMEDNYNG